MIWNCAASSGSPRTASEAVLMTSERRYWWKFGSSYEPGMSAREAREESGWLTTARMKEFPGWRVVVPLAAEVVEVGVLPPVVVGTLVVAPGRHWE